MFAPGGSNVRATWGGSLWFLSKPYDKRHPAILTKISHQRHPLKPNMSAPELSRVEIGAIEGRARNLRGRQHELRSLFAHLTAHSDKLVQAIRTEEACLLHEAEVAVGAILLDLRKHYDRLDLKTELATEYKSKRGQSCPERRVATRIVYIIPDTAFLAFSVFSALCAAIEAGSCCVVEVHTHYSWVDLLLTFFRLFQLPTTAQKSAQLVRQAITEALDKDTFAVVSRRAPADFLARCLVVDQLGRLDGTGDFLGRVVSAPTTRAVALVDRTADPNLAAKEVVASRLAFGGRSHCAVDQVFVNEFVADDFLDAVAHELSKYEEARVSDNGTVEETSKNRLHRSARMEQTPEMQDAENGVDKRTCKSVWRGHLGLAVEVVDRYVYRVKDSFAISLKVPRSSRILRCKIRAPLIATHRVTSLDDAIDMCATEEAGFGPIYVFAAGPEANYLSKFIESRAAFFNHIPAQLLSKSTISPKCNHHPD